MMRRFTATFLAVVLTGMICGATTAQSAGNLRYSISVAAFPNESGWHGQWDVGDGFSTIVTAALDESDHFIVLGDTEMRGEALQASGRRRSLRGLRR